MDILFLIERPCLKGLIFTKFFVLDLKFSNLFFFSCSPNCRMIMDKIYPFKAVGKASRKIHKGEELTITYMNLLMPTFMRRRKIRENWYFDCICSRCQDQTEFGSLVGAVKCTKCLEK